MSIRFEELPKGHGVRGVWGEEAEAFRANPGKWAHIEDYDDRSMSDRCSLVSNIKKGHIKAFRDGTFEARNIKGQVWVRFVGESV